MNERSAHFALQAASEPASRAWERGITRTACTGQCDQGRKPCRNPIACRQPSFRAALVDLLCFWRK